MHRKSPTSIDFKDSFDSLRLPEDKAKDRKKWKLL